MRKLLLRLREPAIAVTGLALCAFVFCVTHPKTALDLYRMLMCLWNPNHPDCRYE
jgi:hypothetical protein